MVLPLDMPDDYPWLPGSGKSTLGDLGELAARLGSIVTYDRRGSVYWMDDFESGLGPWKTLGAGDGYEVRIVHTPTFRGDFSARLTAGSTSTLRASIRKRFHPSYLGTYGLENVFSFLTDVENFYVTIDRYDGSIVQRLQLDFRLDDLEIYYLNSNGGYTLLYSGYFSTDDPEIFSTVKIVGDFLNNKWVRVLFNQNEYSLSDQAIYKTASSSPPRLDVIMEMKSYSGINGIGYIDSVIVTVGDV